MIRRIRILIAALIVGMLPFQAWGLDPQQPVDRYILDEWDETNGLDFLTIYDINQSSDGFLWLEGPDTVARFDGRRFTPAGKLMLPYSKHKPQYFFCIFLKDKEGAFWLTGDKGMIKYRDNRFEEYVPIKKFPWEEFNMAIEDSWGNFWMGTMGGYLYSYKNKKLTVFGNEGKEKHLTKHLTGISCILEDSRGQLWVSTDLGVFIMKSGKLTRAKIKGMDEETPVTWLYEDKGGRFWIGTKKGLALEKNDTVRWFTVDHGLTDNEITDIIEDSDGNLWVGTIKGLNRLRIHQAAVNQPGIPLKVKGKSPVNPDRTDQMNDTRDVGTAPKQIEKDYRVTIDRCLENEIINIVFEDSEKNLWIGTEGSGLKRMRDRMLVTESFKTERQDYISALHYTRAGETWAATMFGDLLKIENKQGGKKPRVIERYWCDDYITTMCDDKNGNLWVGTIKKGIYCLTPERKLVHFNHENKLKQIYTLFCDSKNRVWIGTRTGIIICRIQKSPASIPGAKPGEHGTLEIDWKHVEGQCIDLRKIKNIPTYSIQFISESADGDIYLGSFNGLVTLKKGNLDKPEVEKILKEDSVSFVLQDKERPGTLWIGAYGGGLIRKQGDKIFQYINKKIRLPFDSINSIMSDEYGYLWFSSNAGICRLSRKVLDDVADGKTKTITPKTFGVSDGLKSAECTGSSFNASIKTGSGEYWFATKKGVAVFRPEKVKLNKNAPPVYIEEVRVNGKPAKIKAEGIPYSVGNAKRLRFNFTAPTFIGQERVFFRFRLENHDEEWSMIYPGDRRTMEYWNLPDGDYTFHVTACNSDGVWNREGARFHFIVYSGFFKSTTFYIILAVIIVILVLLVHWFAQKEQRIKNKVKKAQSDALDAISSDKYLVRLFRLLEEDKVYSDDSVSLDSLSKKLAVSPRILSRLINEKLDKSFYDLINHYRIEDAKKQLLDEKNNKAILEIAYDIGFNTKSSFNRAFKKETGMTPSQFKKEESARLEKLNAEKAKSNSKKYKVLRNQEKK